MYLNKNSSREEIINYIKTHPYFFLINFSDKPWAQPYIDKAAKMVAREEPIGFLCDFSDKSWAKPYIDKAVNKVAKENPKYFLEHWADRFPQHINLALFALGDKNGSE